MRFDYTEVWPARLQMFGQAGNWFFFFFFFTKYQIQPAVVFRKVRRSILGTILPIGSVSEATILVSLVR